MSTYNEKLRLNLLYLSIGSGHQMAARAIGDAIQRLAPGTPADVFDPLARKFAGFPRLANLGLRLAMRYGGRFYDERWQSGKSGLVAWSARLPWVIDGAVSGDVAAATHVLALRMALAHRERFGFPRKVFGVVTDFGLHGYWPLQGVDGYFVAGEELRTELVQRGFPVERVAASGIPLRLEFAEEGVWQPRRAGGPLRVLILAGGVHSGAYSTGVAWLRQVFERMPVAPAEVRFTIVTGNRVDLLAELETFARHTHFEVNPRGLVGDMASVMRSHDLLVAKPGGATVAESLACGLPLAALKPGPGQESANTRFLQRHGVWIEAYTPEQLAGVIARAVRDDTWLDETGRRCRKLGRPDAALEVARAILQETA